MFRENISASNRASGNLKHTLNSVKHFNQAPNSAAAKHFCRRQHYIITGEEC